MKKLISRKSKKIKGSDAWFYVEEDGVYVIHQDKQLFLPWYKLIK